MTNTVQYITSVNHLNYNSSSEKSLHAPDTYSTQRAQVLTRQQLHSTMSRKMWRTI